MLDKAQITIYDTMGTTVFSQVIFSNKLDVSELRPGLYTVEFRLNDRVLREKVIKR
jgi:hypothetical protein